MKQAILLALMAGAALTARADHDFPSSALRPLISAAEETVLDRKQENATVLGQKGSPKLTMTAFPKRIGKGRLSYHSGVPMLHWQFQGAFLDYSGFSCSLAYHPKDVSDRYFPSEPLTVTDQSNSLVHAPRDFFPYSRYLTLLFPGGYLSCAKQFRSSPSPITLGEIRNFFRDYAPTGGRPWIRFEIQ